MPCCRFSNAPLEPSATDLSDLEPIARQRPADDELNVEKFVLQQLASNQKPTGIFASHRFGMKRNIPPPPRQLGDPACVFSIGWYRHGRERRLHIPCFGQSHIAPAGHNARMQPLCQRPRLGFDAYNRQVTFIEVACRCLRLAGDLDLTYDLSACAHNAHNACFEGKIYSYTVSHGCSS